MALCRKCSQKAGNASRLAQVLYSEIQTSSESVTCQCVLNKHKVEFVHSLQCGVMGIYKNEVLEHHEKNKLSLRTK